MIYRRYAGLYFSVCVDVTDNELAYLESIHLFVEILDHYFSNVCELDLVFNFHKASLQPSLLLNSLGRRSFPGHPGPCKNAGLHQPRELHTLNGHGQVYLILDEFIMGGEIQETSKKV